MNALRTTLLTAAAGVAGLPLFAFAQDAAVSSGYESWIMAGYYLSSLGFLLATLMMLLAVKQFGKSALGSTFTYFLIGTGTFFVITVFQGLGNTFFGISDESMDLWWHLMFYLAMASYFFGLKALVGLGSSESSGGVARMGKDKIWGLVVLVLLMVFFVIPASVDPMVTAYMTSPLSLLGLHHFLAFIIAGLVASYLISVKKNLGQIGRAIANPMVVAIAALSLQHFWELLNESWKVIMVTSDVGEGVEKIFMVIAALGVAYAAWRLRAYSRR